MIDVTEPLANGAELPDHPATTTAFKIIEYGTVVDAMDGTVLKRGMHENELRMLMIGQQMALKHLYIYQIRNRRIFHTRDAVVINVECVDCEPV